MDATDYTQRLSLNVLSLLPSSGLRTQKALADKVGWKDRGRLSRLLNCKQEWNLTDIVEIGQALGYHQDPFIITRPLAEIVGASGPNSRATGTDQLTGNQTGLYTDQFTATLIPFPQVKADGRELRRPAAVIPVDFTATHRSSRRVAV